MSILLWLVLAAFVLAALAALVRPPATHIVWLLLGVGLGLLLAVLVQRGV